MKYGGKELFKVSFFLKYLCFYTLAPMPYLMQFNKNVQILQAGRSFTQFWNCFLDSLLLKWRGLENF